VYLDDARWEREEERGSVKGKGGQVVVSRNVVYLLRQNILL
jgi:hypothetical protein